MVESVSLAVRRRREMVDALPTLDIRVQKGAVLEFAIDE